MALRKAFAECNRAFAECPRHSAKSASPVVMSASCSRFAVPVGKLGLNPTGTTFDLVSAKGSECMVSQICRFFQILAVDVYILGRSWLTLDAMISASSFGLIDRNA